MKKLMVVLLALSLCLGLVGTAMAASSGSHSVAITIETINEITVTGTPTLVISSTGEVTDSSCTLDWSTNATASKGAKISAQLGTDYTTGITLEAAVVPGAGSSGASIGTLTLSFGSSQDLVTGLTCEDVTGSAITYTATATMAVEPGIYTQTVTYTITAL